MKIYELVYSDRKLKNEISEAEYLKLGFWDRRKYRLKQEPSKSYGSTSPSDSSTSTPDYYSSPSVSSGIDFGSSSFDSGSSSSSDFGGGDFGGGGSGADW